MVYFVYRKNEEVDTSNSFFLSQLCEQKKQKKQKMKERNIIWNETVLRIKIQIRIEIM